MDILPQRPFFHYCGDTHDDCDSPDSGKIRAGNSACVWMGGSSDNRCSVLYDHMEETGYQRLFTRKLNADFRGLDGFTRIKNY